MCTAAELYAGAVFHHAHFVAVFLAEEGHSAELLGFGDGHSAVLLQRQALAYHAVHATLHIANLLLAQLGKVAEVETQALCVNARTFLLNMLAEYLA